jgi:hypothetical protein
MYINSREHSQFSKRYKSLEILPLGGDYNTNYINPYKSLLMAQT